MAGNAAQQKGTRSGSWLKRPIVLWAIVVVVLIALRLLPTFAHVLLVLFGATVLAVLMDGVSVWLARNVRLPRWLGLLLFILLSLGVPVAVGWLLGARISSQFNQISQRASQGVNQVEGLLRQNDWTRPLVSGDAFKGSSGSSLSLRSIWNSTRSIFSTALGAVTNLLILAVTAIYLAVNPGFYRHHTLRLVPPERRARYGEVAARLGTTLRWWFVGRFASMAVTGTLTGLGLWIAGVPMALALGLIAGLLTFVPFIGPIVAAIPGLLVAWTQGRMTVLYALIVYVVAQALEGNLITPLIQKRTVAVPPALLISGQLLLGSLFGIWGVLWATPLIVVAMVVVQTLYLEDILHEKPQ